MKKKNFIFDFFFFHYKRMQSVRHSSILLRCINDSCKMLKNKQIMKISYYQKSYQTPNHFLAQYIPENLGFPGITFPGIQMPQTERHLKVVIISIALQLQQDISNFYSCMNSKTKFQNSLTFTKIQKCKMKHDPNG